MPNPYTARAAFPGVVRGSYTRFTDGTHIYAGGGLTAWCAGFQNTFYRYTPATDTWAAMANIPTNHAGGGSMGNPTTGYAVGGSMNCAGTGGTVTRYNIGANTWTTGLPAVPTPVHGSSASHTATGDTLYVFGGKTADGTTCGEYTPSLRMYRPSLNTWTTLAPLPADGRGWPVIVEINGRVFAGLGTKWTGCPTNYTDWWEYAPATNTWTARAAYPGPGGAKYGYFALGGYIYVADPNFQMYRYDPAANTWATLPCPIPISTDAALVVGTSAYLFDIDNTRQVWQFTP